jgi:hypothetical protein
VFDSSGYDGQFYWRMAVAPDAHELSAVHGVRLDQGIRLGRVGYPVAAWLGALGHDDAVAWSLVVVNVLGIGAIAGAAALTCRRHGLDPRLGLLVAGSSGLVMALSRDLTEVLMVAGLVAGMAALDARRPVWAAVAWSFAVLVHEQALLVVGVFALVRIVDLVRSRRRPGAPDAAWAAPILAFAAWQAICDARWGSVPVAASGSKNLGLPLTGLGGLVRDWLQGDIPRQEVLFPIQLVFVVALAVTALRSRSRPDDRWQRIAVVGGVLLAVLISYNVWKQPAELRQISILPAVAWMTIMCADVRPPRSLVAFAVLVTGATVALRVVAV